MTFFRWYLFVLFVVFSVGMSEESKLASKFARASLDLQLSLAEKVGALLGRDIILFCSDGCLEGGETKLAGGIRYIEKGDLVGVLSSAAQKVFATANTYSQFLGVRERVQVGVSRVCLVR